MASGFGRGGRGAQIAQALSNPARKPGEDSPPQASQPTSQVRTLHFCTWIVPSTSSKMLTRITYWCSSAIDEFGDVGEEKSKLFVLNGFLYMWNIQNWVIYIIFTLTLPPNRWGQVRHPPGLWAGELWSNWCSSKSRRPSRQHSSKVSSPLQAKSTFIGRKWEFSQPAQLHKNSSQSAKLIT